MERIPDRGEPDRYAEQNFQPSGFLEIRSNEYVEVEMQYPILGMRNAEAQCFVREEVYERLMRAAKTLPQGMKFKILDAWRPFALQKELFEVYSARIIRDFRLQDCEEEERNAVIRKYVCDPIFDRDIPPVHTTGGAVDLTLIGADGVELDMGTGFDAFTEKTHTAYFERLGDDCLNGNARMIRENRRLLYHTMTSAGFVNYPSEWWHFDYGDRFWGFYEKKSALYRGVFTKEEIYGGSKEK